jgi:protein-tyrosine phosphatase
MSYKDLTEIIRSRLYLTSLDGIEGIKNINSFDIIVSILHYKPIIKNFNGIQIYYESQDNEEDNIEQYFESFKLIMNNNPDKIILIHCLYGQSRSVTLIISYLITIINNKKGNNIGKIIRNIRKKREIFPNEVFIQKLRKYRLFIHDY